MTAIPSDRRVRRTRTALQEALLALMIDKGYEAITVQDIIDRADVGRSTFYTHYTGKDELLHDGFAELRAIVSQPALAESTGRPIRALGLPLLRHIQQRRQLAQALFARPDRTPVLRSIEQLLVDAVRVEVPSAGARVAREALARYVVGAYLGLLEWWLSADEPAAPEEIDRIFRTLVTPSLRAAA